MKVILPYFLLAVALVLLFSMWRSNRELKKYRREDNRRSQEVIAAKQAEIINRDSAILKLQVKMGKDSAEFKSRLIASNDEIKVYKRTIAKLRPSVQAKIDSFPDLREFVAAQDSIIEKQDSLIHDQELFCQLQVRDLGRIIQLNEEKYLAQTKITDAWRVTAQGNESLLRKEKNKKVFWKITSGILAGGIVFFSLKE